MKPLARNYFFVAALLLSTLVFLEVALAGAENTLSIPVTVSSGGSNVILRCQVCRNPAIPVTALAFSMDGKTLYAGGYREILVWDVVSGRLEKRITSPLFSGQIQVLARNDASHLLAAGEGIAGSKGKTHFIDTSTRKVVGEGPVANDVFYALAFTEDGKWLAAGGADPVIRIWDMVAKTNVALLNEHTERVTSLGFSSNNLCLASASVDSNLLLWETTEWKSVERIQQGDPVHSLAFNSAGEILAWTVGGANERWVRHRKIDYVGFIPSTNGITVPPQTNALTNTLTVTNLASNTASTNQVTATNLTNSASIAKAAAPPPRRNVNRQVVSHDCKAATPLDIVWNPEGKRLYAACDDGAVKVLAAGPATMITNLTASTDWFYRVAIDLDGALLAAAGADGAVRIWSAFDFRLIASLVNIPPSGWCVITPAGYYSASSASAIKWVDTQDQPVGKVLVGKLNEAGKVRETFTAGTEAKRIKP